MNLTRLFVQSVLSFQSLSVLICRIISDGDFNTIKVVYDSNSLENCLISEIVALLPTNVQFLFTNIKDKEAIIAPVSDWHILTDRTLQLIFVDQNHLEGNFRNFPQVLNSNIDYDKILYRLYVLLVSNVTKPGKYAKSHWISNLNPEMSSMLAVYDIANENTEIFLFPNKTGEPNAVDYPIFVHQGRKRATGDIFDATLNYWYRNIRIISFYSKEYISYERLHLKFEVYPKKNAHLIACINSIHNSIKGSFQNIIVEEKVRIMSNDSTISFKRQLFEVVKNKNKVIYEDVMSKLKVLNSSEL